MTGYRQDIIFISWEYHRRAENLAAEFGVPWVCFQSNAPRWQRHPQFLWGTIRTIAKTRPRILIVQNPSAFLTLLAILLKVPFGFRLVVDAHNAGVYPFEESYEKYGWVFPLMHRWADLTIVTNEVLAATVRKNGGVSFVLPDALPVLVPVRKNAADRREEFVITFICTFASDEPYGQVFQAARQLPSGFLIYVTGNSAKMEPEATAKIGPNIHLTGFLPEDDYVDLLASSDAVMDLTTFDDCLVCGAYEAVSLGVPMILSASPALREYFNRGAVYAANDAVGLAAAMIEVRDDHARLKEEVVKLRSALAASWGERRDELLGRFGESEWQR